MYKCFTKYFLSVAFFIILLVWAAYINLYQNKSTLKINFEGFDNISGSTELIIPNIVHYVIFGQNSLNFVSFVSILSAIKVQKPEKLIIHSDVSTLTGRYWDALEGMNSSLELRQIQRPTHVFGQPLSSVYHATDIARIQVLMEWGGIYVDTDTVILRSLDKFRHFEMVVGWPPEQYMGTQILMSHKEARFLEAWLDTYRYYRPRDWYYNAGQLPTQQILEKAPWLVHRVPRLFGVQNLSPQLYGIAPWPLWKTFYTIHLLSRHPPAPQNLDEYTAARHRNTFSKIIKRILYELKPHVHIPSATVGTNSTVR